MKVCWNTERVWTLLVHVFICNIPYIHNYVVQEVYSQDRSPEIDDVEGLAAAATKYLELLKQKDKAEGSFIIEQIVGKLLRTETTRPFTLFLSPSKIPMDDSFTYTFWSREN